MNRNRALKAFGFSQAIIGILRLMVGLMNAENPEPASGFQFPIIMLLIGSGVLCIRYAQHERPSTIPVLSNSILIALFCGAGVLLLKSGFKTGWDIAAFLELVFLTLLSIAVLSLIYIGRREHNNEAD